jgi:hypothetical protein
MPMSFVCWSCLRVLIICRWASGATSPNGIGKSSAGGIYVNSYYDSGNIEVRQAARHACRTGQDSTW